MFEETLKYVISFLGGGFAGAVGNWLHANRSASKLREVTHLQCQLENLYGPLYFFTCQNVILFDLCKKFYNALDNEIGSKNWSHNEKTQSTVRQDTENIIAISNTYIERVVENNAKITELLEKSWHLSDSEDIQEFSQFVVHHVRFKTEFDGKLKAPFAVYRHVGEISYMSQGMIDRIENKFSIKVNRLSSLR